MKQRAFWFLLNPYGWLILVLSVITAFVLGFSSFWWLIFLGIIGYQAVLLVEMTLGRTLGRSGTVRLARAEQENRELRAEQARLLGAIQERDDKLAAIGSSQPSPESSNETPPEAA